MKFENIEVKINEPYPEIVGATVALLKNLANGKVGEMAASSQYIFQSVVADVANEEIAEIFEEIGIVEMMHLDMLMHAISKFGGIPKYEDAVGNYFNTSGLNYTVKLKDMLMHNMNAEQRAIKLYEETIRRVNNSSLIKLLERIIKDEKRHVEIFKQILNTVEFMSI